MKTALEKLPSVGIVDVVRADTETDHRWLVTFLTNTGDQPMIEVAENDIRGTCNDGTIEPTLTNTCISVEEIVKGELPAGEIQVFETIFEGLNAGKMYAAKVVAYNSYGRGPSTETYQNLGRGAIPLAITASNQPAQIALGSEALSPLSASQFHLTFVPPDANGDSIDYYRVEWATGDFSLFSTIWTLLTEISSLKLVVKKQLNFHIIAQEIKWKLLEMNLLVLVQ